MNIQVEVIKLLIHWWNEAADIVNEMYDLRDCK